VRGAAPLGLASSSRAVQRHRAAAQLHGPAVLDSAPQAPTAAACLPRRSSDGAHSLHYELGWRRVSDPTSNASKAVLAQTGNFLKSSLR
jgi:hypothetical protein